MDPKRPITTLSSEFRATIRLAAPIMGAQLLILSMTFVDNLIVGRLGAKPLAALALAHGLYSFVFIIVTGVFSALSPMFSYAFGSENYLRLGHITRQGLVLSLVIAAVLGVTLCFTEPILALLGQDADLIPTASEYLKYMAIAVPGQLAYVVMRNLCEGCGDSLPTIIIVGIAALLNIPLDYALVFGEMGLPKLGVAGAAIATGLLSWMMFFALVAYTILLPRYSRMRIWLGAWWPDPKALWEFLRLGIPLGGAIGAEVAFFVLATFLMGAIGTVELAAHQVALNAASMMFMLPLGLSYAVGIRIGHHVGAGSPEYARLPWIAGVMFVAGSQALTAFLFLAVPEWIIGLYGQTGPVLGLGVELVIVAGFFQFFDGFQVVGMGALRGLKDARFALVATIIAFWVIGFSAVMFSYKHQPPLPVGIWYGLLCGLGVASILHHTRVWILTKRLRSANPSN